MKTSWMAAAGVTLILVLWMASGLFSSNESEPGAGAAPADANQSELMRVEVQVAEPASEQRSVVLRGEVSANRMVHLRAETAGRAADIVAKRGARVEAGELLVGLEPGAREALLAAARAQLASARAEQNAAASLGRRGLQSQLQTEQAAAAASLATAEVDRLERDLANTRIQAPFAGVLEQLPIEVGQLVERGDLVAALVDDSAFKVTARAAQQIASELKPGQAVAVTLITGEQLQGTLSWVSSVADAATRSFEIEAVIDNPEAALAAGVSATLSIPTESVEAVFVSPSTFTLAEDGQLGVKVLDDDDRVLFAPVSMLRTSLEGAWVSGIEPGTRIVTLGQGFVREGEQVHVSVVAAAAGAAQ